MRFSFGRIETLYTTVDELLMYDVVVSFAELQNQT